MRTTSRFASVATCAALAGLLGACSVQPQVSLAEGATGPITVTPPPAPATATVVVLPAAYLEYGRITNIEFLQGGSVGSRINVPGAVVGGVAGAVIGNQIGRGGGRDAATVLGGAAGAAIGSQVGKPAPAPAGTSPAYRLTIQTDAGVWRTYDVPAVGDLRVGDPVRIENGVIYRA